MCHLNKHFEKSIIILVITMFLTILNMRVYSFVGKYRTTSPALTANASERFFTKKEQRLNLPGVALACLSTAAILTTLIGLGLAVNNMLNLAFADIEIVENGVSVGLVDGEKQPLLFNTDKYYTKYDFSKFDN